MNEVLAIVRALGDPHRVRALLALQGGELCLCHLIDLLDLAPSSVSRHMALLRAAGLVEARKEGRWQYFRLAPARRGAWTWIRGELAGDRAAKADARRVRALRRQPKERLCRHYRD